MDETTFRDSNSFLINGKSFAVRYFPSTETTILVRTNSVPISQQELSQVTGIDSVITSDGGINYGEIITATNSFASLGAPQEFLSDFANSPQIQQTVLDTARTVSGQSQPTPTEENPDQEGGSTPITQPTTGTEPTDAMLVYPEDLGRSKQDRIKFQAYTYTANRLFAPGPNPIFDLNPVTFKKEGPAVILPIQPSMTDQNSVGWEPDTMNPLEIAMANLSSNLMKAGTTDGLEKILETNFKAMVNQSQTSSGEIKTFLVGQAIGVNNILSRVNGKVLNPNLELLFQGPQLRPFNYTFKMSARSRDEAKTIKKIIKYFKQNMAVKKDNNIFLKAPNVFKIQYQYKNAEEVHKSLNLIKMCALTNCSVDYTPLGTYMTYSDGEGTMIAYTMTLSFQELTPIYDTDYNEFNYGDDEKVSNHPIGA